MDLVLHAGMHKTGTSSFQKLLQMWETPPDSEAWVLPSRLNAKNSKKFDPNWINRQLNKDLKHVVVSHEGLSTFSTTHWTKLRDAIPSWIEPRIIIVFRPWRNYLISRWTTCCMRRDSNSFHQYINQLIHSQEERVELDHSLCIKRPISAGFKRLECIDYEANITKEKSILPILCRCTGIPNVQGIMHYNKRPETKTIEILRIINGARSEMEQRDPNDLFVSIGEHRPVDKFYDQLQLLRKLIQKESDLMQSILSKLNDTKEQISNQKLRDIIYTQQAKLTHAMEPWIVGEEVSQTNHSDVCPNGLFSKLEYQDLGKPLKQKIKAAINRLEYI